MKRFKLISPDGLRKTSTQARGLITASAPWLISIAAGVIFGAVVGGIVAGLDYLAFIGDLHHGHKIDAFAFNYLDYLLNDGIEGAGIGAACGLIGALSPVGIVFGADAAPRVRKIVVWVAGGVVIAGVAVCVAFVFLACFGHAVRGPVGPSGAVTPGDFLIPLCGYAAGLVVGAVRTGD